MENLKYKTRQDKQDGQDIFPSVAIETKFSILLNRIRLFILFILKHPVYPVVFCFFVHFSLAKYHSSIAYSLNNLSSYN